MSSPVYYDVSPRGSAWYVGVGSQYVSSDYVSVCAAVNAALGAAEARWKAYGTATCVRMRASERSEWVIAGEFGPTP